MIEITTETYEGGKRKTGPALIGDFQHSKGAYWVFITHDGAASLIPSHARIGGRTGTPPLPEAKAEDLISIDGIVYRITDNMRGHDPILIEETLPCAECGRYTPTNQVCSCAVDLR